MLTTGLPKKDEQSGFLLGTANAMENVPLRKSQDNAEEAAERMYEDRRAFHRFKVNMPLRYHFLELEISGKGALFDIGASGIGLVTNRRLNLFAPLAIKIEIPFNKETFYFTGEVAWVRRVDFNTYRAGIRFNSPSLIGVWKVLNGMRLREEKEEHKADLASKQTSPEPYGVLHKVSRTLNSACLKFTSFLF